MNPTLIHHFLEHSARHWPDKIALIHEDVRASYQQINSQANQLAVFLIDQGVFPGDRVVLLLENSLEYVVSYYAVLKAGAVAVPINTELKRDGLLPLLKELEPRCLVTSRKFERLLRATDLSTTTIQTVIIKSPKLNLKQSITVFDMNQIVSDLVFSDLHLNIQSSSLSSIIYTSGSTGKPKGVMLSHHNIVINVKSICQYLELTENDIQMVVLPFFYVMGKSLLNTHFAVGGRVVINNKFAYPAAVVNQMIDEKVTGFAGVPSTYAHLLHMSPLETSREKLVALRYCSQAGGHLSEKIKKKLLEILPKGTKLYIMYGATEASARLTYVEPSLLEKKIASIGRAISGVNLKVLGENGNELPAGEIGEIVAVGDNIMQGYWCDPEASAEVLTQYGYHTGDLGYKDEEGYFFVVGRKDNQLKVGGHRINTQEIEDVIMSTGLVVEVIVLGIPDLLLGNKLVAMVVPQDSNLVEKAVLARCSKVLPSYKMPQQIVLVENLPASANGKVDRKLCEQIIIDFLGGMTVVDEKN